MTDIEDLECARVMDELEDGTMDHAGWVIALTTSDGDHVVGEITDVEWSPERGVGEITINETPVLPANDGDEAER